MFLSDVFQSLPCNGVFEDAITPPPPLSLLRTELSPLCETQAGRVAALAPESWLKDVVSSR